MPISLTRSIITIIIPGGVAAAPWLIISAQNWPFLVDFYADYTILMNGVLFGIIVIIGTVLESFGSTKEVRWDDEREEEFDVKENWFAYLSRVVENEPVANRYLGRMVTSMYFELAMTYATAIFFFGCAVLAFFANYRFHVGVGVNLLTIGILSAVFFAIQAKKSHLALCRTRRQLNRRLDNAN